jgi:hypothetical protein
MYNKLPATIKMNKQTDKEKETDKLTYNKEDRRIHKKVCIICDNKKNHKYLPTTIISTKNPATQITYKKPCTKTQIDTKICGEFCIEVHAHTHRSLCSNLIQINVRHIV